MVKRLQPRDSTASGPYTSIDAQEEQKLDTEAPSDPKQHPLQAPLILLHYGIGLAVQAHTLIYA